MAIPVCKPCGSLDLSVLVEILSGVDSNHGTGPRRYVSSIQGQHYVQYKEGHAHLADYVL